MKVERLTKEKDKLVLRIRKNKAKLTELQERFQALKRNQEILKNKQIDVIERQLSFVERQLMILANGHEGI
ncbi:MAG: hypothetical protein ACK4ND_15970 [Cytophagaceae bacterium]